MNVKSFLKVFPAHPDKRSSERKQDRQMRKWKMHNASHMTEFAFNFVLEAIDDSISELEGSLGPRHHRTGGARQV